MTLVHPSVFTEQERELAAIEHHTDKRLGSVSKKAKSLMRDSPEGRCAYCNHLVRREPEQWHMMPSRDHVIPVCRGGSNAPENIVLSCQMCNSAKADMTGDEYRHLLATATIHPGYVAWITKQIIKRVRAGIRPKLERIF